jgi:ankyrin repeat protein
VRAGALDMVELLLGRGLEPLRASHNGRSPLHVAALHGRAACAAALLRAAAARGAALTLLLHGDCGGALALHEARAPPLPPPPRARTAPAPRARTGRRGQRITRRVEV